MAGNHAHCQSGIYTSYILDSINVSYNVNSMLSIYYLGCKISYYKATKINLYFLNKI